jgi:hypothetical protein
MSRQWPALKNNNQLTMVGRLEAVCNRGVGKEAMGERSTTKPIPLTKLVGRQDDDDENEMINYLTISQ